MKLVLITSPVTCMLKNTARSISLFLHKLFNLSLSTGQLPSEWKVSNVSYSNSQVGIHYSALIIDPSPMISFCRICSVLESVALSLPGLKITHLAGSNVWSWMVTPQLLSRSHQESLRNFYWETPLHHFHELHQF